MSRKNKKRHKKPGSAVKDATGAKASPGRTGLLAKLGKLATRIKSLIAEAFEKDNFPSALAPLRGALSTQPTEDFELPYQRKPRPPLADVYKKNAERLQADYKIAHDRLRADLRRAGFGHKPTGRKK